jgi:predicted secreted hydrolase
MNMPFSIHPWIWSMGWITSLLLLISSIPERTLSAESAPGFMVATPGKQLVFPVDHGSHPDFRIEWWYITGHLRTKQEARRLGYQATFFRIAQQMAQTPSKPDSKTSQWYLAHMALLDLNEKRFIHQERLHRPPMASAAIQDMDLRHGNWSLKRHEDSVGEHFELVGSVLAEALFKLTLRPTKPLTLFGDKGYSRKGSQEQAASYYMTYTRLETEGSLQLGDKVWQVSGQSWMDHEVSSSQLGKNQVGWDWISIRFNDGYDVMAYRMRTLDGEADPASTLAWVDPEGQLSQQPLSDAMWQPLEYWKSPDTGITYPIKIALNLPLPHSPERGHFRVIPLYSAQEMKGRISGITYWEGACEVLNADNQVVGEAYMELAGYDGRKLTDTLN